MEDLLQVVTPMLMDDEKLKLFAYKDTTGHNTIGYGHNLDAKGISKKIAVLILGEDIDEAIAGCESKISFFKSLDIPRQSVLVNLAFNMGLGGLLSFEKMLGFMSEGRYNEAARELQNSLEMKEVPNRIFPLIKILETGNVT